MKKLIFGGVVLTAVVAAAVFWLLVQADGAGAPTAEQSVTSESATESSQVSEPAEPVVPTEQASLAAVNGYIGGGDATRTTEGKYVHSVTASLDAPAAGKFYEGWIVVDANDFISTGRLSEEAPGEWSLEYTSNRDLSAYNSVVITEETEANGLDNVPEAHVLEGSF